MAWRQRLDEIFRELRQSRRRETAEERHRRVEQFIRSTAAAAFADLKSELEKHDRKVEVTAAQDAATITVFRDDDEEFYYAIKARRYHKGNFAFPMLPLEDAYGHVYRAEALVREGPLHRDVTDFSKERIIQNFLYEYQRHIHWTL